MTDAERASDTPPKPSSLPVSDHLVEEWMYYRALVHGESEFQVRNKQVTTATATPRLHIKPCFIFLLQDVLNDITYA